MTFRGHAQFLQKRSDGSGCIMGLLPNQAELKKGTGHVRNSDALNGSIDRYQ